MVIPTSTAQYRGFFIFLVLLSVCRLRKTARDFQKIPKSVFLQVPRSKCLSVQHPPTHRSTKSLLQLGGIGGKLAARETTTSALLLFSSRWALAAVRYSYGQHIYGGGCFYFERKYRRASRCDLVILSQALSGYQRWLVEVQSTAVCHLPDYSLWCATNLFGFG